MTTLSYEFVKIEIEKDSEYLLLSTEYVSSSKILNVLYLPTNTVYETKWSLWQQNARPHRFNSLKINFELIKAEFLKEKNYKLLSTEYKDHKTPLIILHTPSDTIFTISWKRWKQGIRWYRNKVSTKTITDQLKELNFTLLNQYENSKSKLKIQCYREHIFDTTWRKFKKISLCPICEYEEKKINSKGEKLIYEYLSCNKFEFSREYKFPDCKYKAHLRFDFAVHKDGHLQFLIEYQGIQHYQKCDRWENPNDDLKTRQLRDEIKVTYCQKNNIPLLIIKYDELKNISKILKEWIKDYDL